MRPLRRVLPIATIPPMRTAAHIVLGALLLLAAPAFSGEQGFLPPARLEAHDAPNDAGGVICLTWTRSTSESGEWDYVVFAAREADGPWQEIQRFPSTARLRADLPDIYGFAKENTDWHATKVPRGEVFVPEDMQELQAKAQKASGERSALSKFVQATKEIRALEGEREGLADLEKQRDEADEAYRKLSGKAIDTIADVAVELGRLHRLTRDLEHDRADAKREHDRATCYFRLGAARQGSKEPPQSFPGLQASAAARPNWFNRADLNTCLGVIGLSLVILGSIVAARRCEFFLRKIAGLDAVDEALGRCTEMGKPALFVHGLSGVSDVAVIASVNILGRMARRVAEYDSALLVVNNDPVVYSLSSEVVREGFVEAGRPDRFREDHIFMVASRQFPYVAAVAGIMAREQPAANFFMGYFYAESLILAESGAVTGAIQIAGTDAFTQLPFFVTTCDYTLMGEELYAASAYLSREPKLMGTLRGQDIGKAFLIVVLFVGTIMATMNQEWFMNLFRTF